jgi:hypothetical protein
MALLIRSLPQILSTAVTSVVLAALACSASSSITPAEPPPSIQAKVDPALLRRLNDISRRGQSDQLLNVLVRTTTEIDPDQDRQLERLGMTIRSKSSIILSATLPASSILEVAALDFIVRIELAKRLKPREDQ